MIFCKRLDRPDDHLQQQQRVTEVMGVTRGDGTGGGNCRNFMIMFTICFLENFLAFLEHLLSTSDHHPDLIPLYHHVAVCDICIVISSHRCTIGRGLKTKS